MEAQAPDFCNQTAGFCSNQEKRHSLDSKLTGDHFIVEDLLDFSNDDAVITDAFDNVPGNSTESSTVTVVDSCDSSRCQPCFNGADFGCRGFDNDLWVPYDDLAELEWLSNFVEESFSSEDLQKFQLISGMKAIPPDESSETGNIQTGSHSNHHQDNNSSGGANTNNNNNATLHHEMSVPAKARSKRSRVAPCNWASRLQLLSPTTSSSEPEKVTAQTHHPKTVKTPGTKGRDGGEENGVGNREGRRCLHCAAEKTPQWRTGPMGPKTLCNACGVRYKSGRLVPEYRPAASPTFVLTKHSNSHRKVMELRRQKEMARAQQQLFLHHENMVLEVSERDEYLIQQGVGPDFTQLI